MIDYIKIIASYIWHSDVPAECLCSFVLLLIWCTSLWNTGISELEGYNLSTILVLNCVFIYMCRCIAICIASCMAITKFKSGGLDILRTYRYMIWILSSMITKTLTTHLRIAVYWLCANVCMCHIASGYHWRGY